MVDVSFDRYYRYDELTQIIHAFADEYPDLVALESIGQTHEGRDIWLLTLTNNKTGDALEKPAVWVDANIHASEVSGSSAALHLVHVLTTQYGTDDRITMALDTRTFYVIPRISADGAEWALADKPKIVRSSTRPYPFNEDPLEGLSNEDVDGDGRILMMRVEDPNGRWKSHADDPRLLIARDPDEYGGTYYRVYPEGVADNYDGVTLNMKPNKEGLDLNRNFPNNWQPQNKQFGAGNFPLSEPETYAFAKAVDNRRNICLATAYHTFSGVLLRPSARNADTELPAEDLWIYEQQGAKGTDLTGYPNVSIFHDFKYHPKQLLYGGADWMYEELGIFYWAVEIWSIQQQAGIKDYKFIDWYRTHDVDDDIKILKWCDENLDGEGYVDWYEFEHPQLGKVELGGWNFQLAWRNPPPKLLEKEIEPFAEWFIWQALTTPKLETFKIDVESLGGDSYRVRFAVQNTGYLPTYVTKMALSKGYIRGVVTEIDLPENASLKSGKQRVEIGQLEGRAITGTSATPWAVSGGSNTADRAMTEWVITAPKGSEITLTAKHDRAGTVRETITLK
ncbi:MAG: M14 family metallopeptidase [Phototrophicaceae bacterium]